MVTLMHRRKQRVDKGAYKKQKVLMLLVEGETEENYLNYLRYIYNKPLRMEIFKKSKIKKDLMAELELFAETNHLHQNEIILLYDLENDPIEYDKFIHKGKLRHKHTYLVQPCLEYHFLLHYKNVDIDEKRMYTQDDIYQMLITKLPQYRKGKHFNWQRHGIGYYALERGKKYSIEQFQSFDQKVFSMIGKLIEDYFDR